MTISNRGRCLKLLRPLIFPDGPGKTDESRTHVCRLRLGWSVWASLLADQQGLSLELRKWARTQTGGGTFQGILPVVGTLDELQLIKLTLRHTLIVPNPEL